jgi:hypothetical protein
MTPVWLRIRAAFTAILLFTLVFSQVFVPTAPAQVAVPTPAELDQLLSPIALYPDTLVAQITTASTNPQEILDVDNWLHDNMSLTGTALTDAAQAQGFDPAFIALVNFPQVLDMMALHVDDYAAIGQAFQADQDAVSASIQRLRAQAYAAGSLKTTPQQEVQVQQVAGQPQPIYVIQPVNPQVVYVPVYDPTVVYVRPAPGVVVSAPFITFGIGIGIGALLVSGRPYYWGGWGWNWGGRRLYYNGGPWGGWGPNPYRPPHIWYRPRPIVWSNRPGYGGNWGYRPPNYRPPSYRPPNYRPPTYRPPSSGPGNGRPGTNPPNGNKPPNGTRPPNGNPPPNNGKPTIQPVKPGTPGGGTPPPSGTKPNRPPGGTPPSGTKPNRPPGGTPPSNGTRPPTSQPDMKPPAETKPSQPSTGTAPSNGTRPSGNRPPSGNQPSVQPSRPPSSGNPGGQPGTTRPSGNRPSGNKPPEQQKPPSNGNEKPEVQTQSK